MITVRVVHQSTGRSEYIRLKYYKLSTYIAEVNIMIKKVRYNFR